MDLDLWSSCSNNAEEEDGCTKDYNFSEGMVHNE